MVGQWSFGCDQVLPSGDNRSCHNCKVTTKFRFISQFHWLVVTSELFLGIRKFCTYIRASQRSFHTPFCISSTWGLSARENHQNQLVFKIIFLILSWPYIYIYTCICIFIYIYTHTHIIMIYSITIFPSKIATFDRQIQILVGSTSILLLTSP